MTHPHDREPARDGAAVFVPPTDAALRQWGERYGVPARPVDDVPLPDVADFLRRL